MAPLRFSLVVALGCALASPATATAARATRPADAPWHAKLIRSQPATHDTLASSPTAIKLWFSERVELEVSRIRLVGPAGTPLALGAVSRITGENAQAMMATVSQPLKPGTYRVRWTAAAEDGHVMKGEFSFVIAPGK